MCRKACIFAYSLSMGLYPDPSPLSEILDLPQVNQGMGIIGEGMEVHVYGVWQSCIWSMAKLHTLTAADEVSSTMRCVHV